MSESGGKECWRLLAWSCGTSGKLGRQSPVTEKEDGEVEKPSLFSAFGQGGSAGYKANRRETIRLASTFRTFLHSVQTDIVARYGIEYL